MTQDQIEEARRGLIEKGWLIVQGRMHWIRNGLRYEPSMSLNNQNHRKSIERWMKGLPKLRIVELFAEYYELKAPFSGASVKGLQMAPRWVDGTHCPRDNEGDTQWDTPSHPPSHPQGDTRSLNTETESETETESNREETSYSPDGESDALFDLDEVEEPAPRPVMEVFDYWRERRAEVIGKTSGPPMQPSKKRLTAIRCRLQEGYQPATLKRAIDGCLVNDFNVQNGYTDITLICRDQAKVEQYLAYADKKKAEPGTSEWAAGEAELIRRTVEQQRERV